MHRMPARDDKGRPPRRSDCVVSPHGRIAPWQHAVWFCSALPALTWQPTDQDPEALRSIAAWRDRQRSRPSRARRSHRPIGQADGRSSEPFEFYSRDSGLNNLLRCNGLPPSAQVLEIASGTGEPPAAAAQEQLRRPSSVWDRNGLVGDAHERSDVSKLWRHRSVVAEGRRSQGLRMSALRSRQRRGITRTGDRSRRPGHPGSRTRWPDVAEASRSSGGLKPRGGVSRPQRARARGGRCLPRQASGPDAPDATVRRVRST
jgi:hypothetical protein